MTLYLIRAIRYILRIAVILGIVFAILHFTGMLDIGGQNLLHVLFMSNKGLILIAALVILALIYPRLAFGEATMPVDAETRQREINDAFMSIGYVYAGEENGVMKYRSKSFMNRLLASFNDTVRITPVNGGIKLEGMKKDVARTMSRIEHMAGL